MAILGRLVTPAGARYVNGDPVNLVDPSGHAACSGPFEGSCMSPRRSGIYTSDQITAAADAARTEPDPTETPQQRLDIFSTQLQSTQSELSKDLNGSGCAFWETLAILWSGSSPSSQDGCGDLGKPSLDSKAGSVVFKVTDSPEGATEVICGLSGCMVAGESAVEVGGSIVELTVGGTDDANLITVRHYTDEAGKTSIQDSGNLRAGSYVTDPSEIPPGATQEDIERLLEIDPGKGAQFIELR